jgi:hypothetical protein
MSDWEISLEKKLTLRELYIELYEKCVICCRRNYHRLHDGCYICWDCHGRWPDMRAPMLPIPFMDLGLETRYVSANLSLDGNSTVNA